MSERKMVSVRLDGGLLGRVDALAKRLGTNRSAVMESALEVAVCPSEAPVGVSEELPVPSPEEKGTAGWRDPTEEEVGDALRRHPELSRERAVRLARAEAWQRDRGLLPPVREGRPTRSTPTREVDGGPPARGEADFDVAAERRAQVFGRLRTPDSVKGIKPKDAA